MLKNLRILFIAPRFHTNQAEFVKILKRHGCSVRFLVKLKGKTENYSETNPIVIKEAVFSQKIRKLGLCIGPNKKRFFPNISYLKNKIFKYKPNVTIIRKHGFWFSLVSAYLAKLADSKIVFYDQIEPEVLEKRQAAPFCGFMRKVIFEFWMRFFDANWFTTISGKKKSAFGFRKKLFYLPFMVPVNKKKVFCRKKIKIISVGKFLQRKNHLLLIKAFAKADRLNKATLSIFGEYQKEKSKKILEKITYEINQKNLSKKIKVFININHQKMLKLYKNYDLFILPATQEPASVSVCEALGQGLPVICSDTCGTKTYIKNGKTGFIFTDNCLNDLTKKIKICLHKEQLKKMGKSVYKNALETFSKEKFIRQFCKIISYR